jgi:saccharopine dehydrogenase-like NADP-dependent oxidoreductase
MKVIIFGGGQIGTAVEGFCYNLFYPVMPGEKCEVWDKLSKDPVDVDAYSGEELTQRLRDASATHVIVAMPFTYNEKIANAAFNANCHYIDFTEDDVMADKVQAIYRQNPSLTCAVKCGLAPGFINYLGHSLVKDITGEDYGFDGKCTELMISVGALPRNVNGRKPEDLYNLSWSVDGLVNEYIRPCRVRWNGSEIEVDPLTGIETVIADGVQYEAACTSGGIGSLVKELKNVPRVVYKTLRYPGHYEYVRDAVSRNNKDFDKIKAEFLKIFPFNTDDVIAVYAEAKGVNANNTYVRRSYSAHFVGVEGLSAIQSTTAGGGVAVLELMLAGKISGIVNHADISLEMLSKTNTFQAAYKKRN